MLTSNNYLVKSKNVLCFCILLYCLSINSQEFSNYKVDIPSIPYLSPEAASLGKYGKIPVGEYTGVPKIEIPLYTIRSGELELPISLSYHASGIKVNQEATWVGLGWDLMVGGCITMNVAGDFNNSPIASDGSESFLPKHTYTTPYIKSIYYDATKNPRYHEYVSDLLLSGRIEPEIFQANFCGHTIMFYLRWDKVQYRYVTEQIGKIDAKYKIELHGNIDTNGFPTVLNSWTITDSKGIIYEFGTQGVEGYELLSGSNPKFVQSWFITKITHPIKGNIDFIYTEEFDIYPATSISHSITKYYGTMEYNDSQPIESPIDYDPNYKKDFIEQERLQTNALSGSLFKRYLKKIVSDECTLDFYIGNRKDIRGDSRRLDSILVHNVMGNTMKRVNFDYSYFIKDGQNDNTNAIRLKLENLQIDDMKYSFSYNITPLPLKDSFSQDFWGYYNGARNIDLIPKIRQMTMPGLSVMSERIGNANRFADGSSMKAGMLEKIIYPTKGYTVYEFEPHVFDNGDRFITKYPFEIPSYANTNIGGGLRVKSVSNHDANGKLLENIKYSYFGGKLKVPINNVEKDKQLFFRPKGESNVILRWFYTINVSSSPRVPLFVSLNCAPVGYTSISVTRGNIKTVTEFINEVANTLSWSIYTKAFADNNSTISNANYYNWIKDNDESPWLNNLRSGSKTELYTVRLIGNDSIWINDIVYDYTKEIRQTCMWETMYAKRMSGVDFNKVQIGVSQKILQTPLFRIVSYPFIRELFQPIGETSYTSYSTDDYDSNFYETTRYSYNNDYLLSKITHSTEIPGRDRIISYIYSGDTYDFMKQRHMLAYPIEVKEQIEVSGKIEETLERSRNNYSLVNEKPLLVSKDWAQGNNVFSRRMTYTYDNTCNIVQAKSYDNIPISYLWSYKNTLPVAKIEGITFEEVEQVLGTTFLQQLKASISPDYMLETVRDNMKGKKAIVSTYTFNPLVGVIKETKSNGYTINYDYDDFGRLFRIKNNDGKIQKEFRYNFISK